MADAPIETSPTERIKSWFHRKRDSSVSYVMEKLIAKQLEPYGRVVDLRIDSGRKQVELDLLLKGELEIISLFIDAYELRQEADTTYFAIKRVRASREWIQLLTQQFLLGKRFLIPHNYATVAKLIL
jgi:hypothetical protein